MASVFDIKNQQFLTELNDNQLTFQSNTFSSPLFYYQELAKRVWVGTKDLKWMILDFGPGTGKTRTAVNMTLGMLNQIAAGLDAHIIYVGPMNVESNFMREINTFSELGELSIFPKSNIEFITFQRFVNQVFTSQSSAKKNFQSYEEVTERIASGEIEVNQKTINMLKKSVVIIDEFQTLYRSDGINSYGYTLRYLTENNIVPKLILLSGTMINTTVNELDYILYIVGETKELSQNKLFETYGDIVKIKNSAYKNIIRKFLMHTLCYQFDKEHHSVENRFQGKKMWKESKIKLYPAYVDNEISEISDDLSFETISKTFLSLLNEALSTGVSYEGPVGKAVAYHIEIEGEGLNKYVDFLIKSGFHKRGTPIIANSICMICSKKYSEHIKSLKHEFQPVNFDVLSGELSQNQRDAIISVFNDPNNDNGRDLYLLLISRVGETSITLKGVNYFYVLSYIPSFSRLEQLLARTNRNNTHTRLPKDMQFVNIYLIVPAYKDSKEMTPAVKYMKKIEDNNEEVEKFMSDLRSNNLIKEIPYGKYIPGNPFNPFIDSDIKILEWFLKEYYKYVSNISFNTIYETITNNVRNFREIRFDNFTKYQVMSALINIGFETSSMTDFNNAIIINPNYEFIEDEVVQIVDTVDIKPLEIKNVDEFKEKIDAIIGSKKIFSVDAQTTISNLIDETKAYTRFVEEAFNNETLMKFLCYLNYIPYFEDDDINYKKNHQELFCGLPADISFAEFYENADIKQKPIGIVINNFIYMKDGSTKELTRFDCGDHEIKGIVQKNPSRLPKFLIYEREERANEIIEDKRKDNRGRSCNTMNNSTLNEIMKTFNNEIDISDKSNQCNCRYAYKWFLDNDLLSRW